MYMHLIEDLDIALPIYGDDDYDEQTYITSQLEQPVPTFDQGLIDNPEVLADLDNRIGLDRVVARHRHLRAKLNGPLG